MRNPNPKNSPPPQIDGQVAKTADAILKILAAIRLPAGEITSVRLQDFQALMGDDAALLHFNAAVQVLIAQGDLLPQSDGRFIAMTEKGFERANRMG